MKGSELIARERERQVSAEGWTPEHDDQHTQCELIQAAIGYAAYVAYVATEGEGPMDPPIDWPWQDAWKPSDDPVRNLVKAGALIAAEIDRLARAKAKEGK